MIETAIPAPSRKSIAVYHRLRRESDDRSVATARLNLMLIDPIRDAQRRYRYPGRPSDGERLMSREYPIIAVTGSSGAGTTTVKRTFERMFAREDVHAAFVDGDAFHRYTRQELARMFREEPERKDELSHFAVEANLLDKLEELFLEYGENGVGTYRHYIHAEDKSMIEAGYQVGTFTEWQSLPRAPTCCSTKGCTVAWSRPSMTSPDTSTCWWAWRRP